MPTSKTLVDMDHTSHWRQDNPSQNSLSLAKHLGQPPLWQSTRKEQFRMRIHLISHHTTDPWGTLVTSSKGILLWVAGIHLYNRHHHTSTLLSHSMEQRASWENTSYLATQEIYNLVQNTCFNYSVHRSPLLDPNLSHMDPNTLLLHGPEIHYNIIHPPTHPKVSKLLSSYVSLSQLKPGMHTSSSPYVLWNFIVLHHGVNFRITECLSFLIGCSVISRYRDKICNRNKGALSFNLFTSNVTSSSQCKYNNNKLKKEYTTTLMVIITGKKKSQAKRSDTIIYSYNN